MPYAMNTEFSRVLANEMKHYSESHDLDTISKVHGELDELKDIMVKNIGKSGFILMRILRFNFFIYFADNVAMRGERLELLVHKTENLSNNVSFGIVLIEMRHILFLFCSLQHFEIQVDI